MQYVSCYLHYNTRVIIRKQTVHFIAFRVCQYICYSRSLQETLSIIGIEFLKKIFCYLAHYVTCRYHYLRILRISKRNWRRTCMNFGRWERSRMDGFGARYINFLSLITYCDQFLIFLYANFSGFIFVLFVSFVTRFSLHE